MLGQFARMGSIGRPSVSAAIRALFSSGEQGAWYDPSDMSTLFQDSAGTTPVTAVEQPVGRMLDKSGRGNHATQSTTTKRPTLKQDANGCYYLSFDGVDDAMQTGNIDFTSTDKMTVWAGVTKLSDSGSAVVTELSGTYSLNPGAFALWAPLTALANFAASSFGSTSVSAISASTFSAPYSASLSATMEINAARLRLRVNSSEVANRDGVSQGSGNYGNYPLYIGSREGTSLYFNGRLYSLIVRGAQSSLSQVEATELYIKQKMRLP